LETKNERKKSMKLLFFIIIFIVKIESDIIKDGNQIVSNVAVIESEFDRQVASVAKTRHRLLETLNQSTILLREVNIKSKN